MPAPETAGIMPVGRMLPRRRGHIVNTASSAGYISVHGLVTYCGPKHAVVDITEPGSTVLM